MRPRPCGALLGPSPTQRAPGVWGVCVWGVNTSALFLHPPPPHPLVGELESFPRFSLPDLMMLCPGLRLDPWGAPCSLLPASRGGGWCKACTRRCMVQHQAAMLELLMEDLRGGAALFCHPHQYWCRDGVTLPLPSPAQPPTPCPPDHGGKGGVAMPWDCLC